MEQVKQLNEQEQMLKALPYPSFLAYKFKVEDFCYKKQVSVNNEQTLIQYLIKKHNKPNTIVLFNGRVVLNNLEKVKVNNNAIPNVINTKFDFLNKEHLNSSLKIEFLESIEDEIKIIIGGSADLYHYSEYYLEDNCKIKITEQFDLTSRVKLNYNNKIQLKQSANLQMLLVETLKNKKSNVVNFNIDLNKKAELNFNLINLNNANVVNTLSSNLKGEQASVKINTINFANEYFKLANLIRLEHLAKETNSQINNFGVVNNEGELIIDGVNIIEQGFSKSQASQKTKIINLTDASKSTANPQLIIKEHDVLASHSAAVGVIDSEQLYYLMSRGLTKRQATELIIMSNIEDVIKFVSDKKLLNEILKIIKNKVA